MIAYVNGQFLPIEQATVSIEDRGFQFADGVYEVVACYGGNFLDMQAHLQRLFYSCQQVRIVLPYSAEQLQTLIEKTYQRNDVDDAMVYIQVSRGAAPRSHAPSSDLTATLIITVRELPKVSEQQDLHGLKAITLQDIRWQRCDIKSIALLASVMGKQQAHDADADEAFWLSPEAHVLEGCSTNAFAIIHDRLVTHPLDHHVLGGITRSMALRLAPSIDLKIEERPWKLTEKGLQEVMLSSTTNAIMPVVQIDQQDIADGKPGPWSRKLRHAMLEEIKRLASA